MVAIRNQRGAPDSLAHSDAKDRDAFIADESHDRRHHHRPEQADRLRMEEPADGFVRSDQGTPEDREDDQDAGEVFHAPEAVREVAGLTPAGEPKSDT